MVVAGVLIPITIILLGSVIVTIYLGRKKRIKRFYRLSIPGEKLVVVKAIKNITGSGNSAFDQQDDTMLLHSAKSVGTFLCTYEESTNVYVRGSFSEIYKKQFMQDLQMIESMRHANIARLYGHVKHLTVEESVGNSVTISSALVTEWHPQSIGSMAKDTSLQHILC